MIYKVRIWTSGKTFVAGKGHGTIEKIEIFDIWWKSPGYIFADVYISAPTEDQAIIIAKRLAAPYRRLIGRDCYKIHLKPV